MLLPTGPLSFVEQTSGGVDPTTPGESAWSFQWQPPSAGEQPVTFYWAVNSANGDFTSFGDHIYLGSLVLDPACPGRI